LFLLGQAIIPNPQVAAPALVTPAAIPLRNVAAGVQPVPLRTLQKVAARPVAARPAAAKPVAVRPVAVAAKPAITKKWGATELSAFILSIGKKQEAAKSLFNTSSKAANKIYAKLAAKKNKMRANLQAVVAQANKLILSTAKTMADIKKTTGGKLKARRLIKNWNAPSNTQARRLLGSGALDSGNVNLINAFLNDNLEKGRQMQSKSGKDAAEKAKKAAKKAAEVAKKAAKTQKKAAKKAAKSQKKAAKKSIESCEESCKD